MKKSLLLLFVCLFGALGGVKAYNFATPTVGGTYYLVNREYGQFWYASSSTIGETNRYYGVTGDLSKATPVTVESGFKLAFNVGGTTYRMYEDKKGNTSLNEGGMDLGLNGSPSDGYNIDHHWQTTVVWVTTDHHRYLRAEGSESTCDWPGNTDDNKTKWYFVPKDDIANYLADVAETKYVSGWERVTSISDLQTNPENYFFSIFSANAVGLMVDASSSNGDNSRPYYKTATNPLTSSQYLFEIENYDGGFALKSCGLDKYFGNNSDSWNFQNLTEKDANCKLTITLNNNNGAFEIQSANADGEGRRYWGLYDYTGYTDGQKFAGNKNVAEKGSFLIYRKLKENLDMTGRITNPNFDSNLDGWTPGNFEIQSGNEHYSGKFAQMWAGSGDLSSGDLNQTITNLPAGIYRLTAKSWADITCHLYASISGVKQEISYQTAEAADRNLTFVVAATGDVAIGIYHDGKTSVTGSTWVSCDEFRLTYIDGLHDLTSVGGLMNADVNKAQQNAVDNYNSNKTAANYIAATEAIAAAEVSKAAYAQINSSDLTAYRTKIGNVLTKTNVYTTEAYNKWYANVQVNYNNGVYTNEEVVTLTENGAYNSEWHSSNQIDDILMSTWDELPMNWNSYHINTWSVEGSEDGSGFLVPFFEYWVASGGVLAAKTMTSTVTGLDANTEYSVNIWARVRQTDNQSKVAGSITMQVGSGLTVDLTTGSQVGSTQFYLNHFTATGSTNGEGQLTITINVAANSNISWLSFKDVAISKQAASGDVQTYSGLINENVVVTPTAEYPIVNISGASFTGTLTANFTSDQNGFIIATAEQKAALDGVKNVVVGNTCDNLVLTDGVKAVIPAALTHATEATYSRTIAAASNFGTICLPYAVESDDDIQYYTVNQIVGNVLKLNEVTSVAAGTPAIFKKKNGEATNITAAASNVAVTDDAGVEASLVGTFKRLAVGDEESHTGTAANKYYYIKNNEFVQGLDYFYINPFRAYIDTNDYSEKPARLVIDTDGATAISELKTLDEEQGLKDGKYLIGGKVIVVKAGKQFNVNGVLK